MPSKSSPAFFGFTPATKHSRPFAYSRHIRVWNCPVLPVMPWVMTFVLRLTRIDISNAPSVRGGGRAAVGGGNHLLRRFGHVVRGDDRQSGFGEDFLAQVLVGALHAYDERYRETRRLRRGDHAFGDRVAAHDAPEDVHENRLQVLV